MNWDIIQWVVMAILAAGGFYLALRKAPAERETLTASAAASYAQAAKLKQEENSSLQKEIDALNARLELVENKKYRVVMEFTIGKEPEVGKVIIEPILKDEPSYTGKKNTEANINMYNKSKK